MTVYKSVDDLKFVKSVELVPKKESGSDDLAKAREVLHDYANMLTAPENPRGLPGIDPVIALHQVSNGNDIIGMPHITPRDKNRLFIYSQALTSLKFGINHFFVIGGDPIHSSVDSKDVRELDVLQTIAALSRTRNYLKEEDPRNDIVNVGSALNPYRENEHSIVKKKIESGSKFFITQAIYQSDLLEQEWIKHRNFKVIAGFIPLRKKSQIEFAENLHINIPQEVKNRLLGADDIVSESVKLILEIVDELKGYIDGIHIMPLGHNKIAKEILESV